MISEFIISEAALGKFRRTGHTIRQNAELLGDALNKVIIHIRDAKQLDEAASANFYRIYYLVQTWNFKHDKEAGKELAEEVKKLLSAKVKVVYTDEPQPFMKMPSAVVARVNEVSEWFL